MEKLAFIDTETTGLNPFFHEVIEIGCVIAEPKPSLFGVIEYVETAALDIRIVPQHIERAEPAALRVNGYNDRDWSDALPPKDALARLAATVNGAMFIAQNVTFDWTFLSAMAERAQFPFDRVFGYRKLDLISLVMGKWAGRQGGPPRYALKALCEFYGVKNENAHTALADARAAFEVYKKVVSVQ